jgi:hypothetical protein
MVAMRLARPGSDDWQAVICAPERVPVVAHDLVEEVGSLVAGEVDRIEARDPVDLVRVLQGRPQATLVVHGLEQYKAHDWQHLDMLRSKLLRNGPVCLVLSAAGAEHLTRYAPNLSSWLGGSLWELEEEDEAVLARQVEGRLKHLRRWAGMSDQQVVEMAREGKLPADPEYQEWLLLLGRSDLVGA